MLPNINGGRSQGGLGAFYAANGLGQHSQQSSPQRAGLGGFGSAPSNLMGYQQQQQYPRSSSMPGQPPYFPNVMPQQPQQPQTQMGANPMMGAMMNMQAQLMRKRQANMMLKQKAMQQQQQQQQRMELAAQQQGARMGMKPLAGGRQQALRAPSEVSNSPSLPGPRRPRPLPPL